jgi:hypothetical protein
MPTIASTCCRSSHNSASVHGFVARYLGVVPMLSRQL